jgi:dihydrofolate reductase
MQSTDRGVRPGDRGRILRGERRNLSWVVPDAEVDRLGGDAVPDSDNVVLFGRRTYDMFEGFWPNALDDDSPDAPNPHGPRSAAMRAMAFWLNEATNVVFSRTRKEVSWNNSRLLDDIDAAAIDAMKKKPGRDMLIFGSGSVVSQLTERGLVDEYQFVVSPILL